MTIHQMTRPEFTDWYYDVGKKAAMRMAVCNGVSYTQVQMWVARLEQGVHHLVFDQVGYDSLHGFWESK
jgi:hypothetical protein